MPRIARAQMYQWDRRCVLCGESATGWWGASHLGPPAEDVMYTCLKHWDAIDREKTAADGPIPTDASDMHKRPLYIEALRRTNMFDTRLLIQRVAKEADFGGNDQTKH